MITWYTIVGAGKMGEAIAYHLLQSKDTKEVLLRDVNLGQAQQTAKKLADERVIPLGAPRSSGFGIFPVVFGQPVII